MDREGINTFLILEADLKENLLNKPQNSCNVDESVIQLINKSGKPVREM
jgi:hypothetical protein